MQNTETLLIVMVAIIGFLVLAQFLAMIAMYFVFKKGMLAVTAHIEDFKGRALPVMDQSKEVLENTKHLIARLEPKLESAASDLAEMTRTASQEVKNLQLSTEEINQRVRNQAARVDAMTTNVLNNVDRAGHLLSVAVSAPVRQVSGVMAAAKAVMDVLRRPAPASTRTPRATSIREEYSADVRQERIYPAESATRGRM